MVKNIILAVVSLLILGWIIGFATDLEMSSIENQVAEDAIEQFNIASEQGDPIQTCVSAGMVTAALLQAKDEARYNEWKEIEKEVCAPLGQ